MIAYRDFPYRGPGFFPDVSRDRENFEKAITHVNDWVAGESIGVNINDLLRVIRIWYRKSGFEPASIPET